MDADERRALEAELAAELAGLSVDVDGDDDIIVDKVTDFRQRYANGDRDVTPGSRGAFEEYVRLDLDQLLRQFASSDHDAKQRQRSTDKDSDAQAPPEQGSSWGLLLASVEQSDTDFFEFIRQDLDDIQTTILAPVPPSEPPTESSAELTQSIEHDTQIQMKRIQEQHEARRRLLQKAQEARELEQQQIAQQMRAMELRLAEEEEAHRRRQLEQQQAKERLAMQQEERSTCKWIAALRRAQENARMSKEEHESRFHDAFLRHEELTRDRERSLMAIEEALGWKRMRFEADKQRKERLMEEKCVLRRRFNGVMFQLVAMHEAKAAEQKKQRDAEKKREAREATLMRSEELSQRRVDAQQRALREDHARIREREAMVKEDALARAWADETHRRATRERLEMEREDRLAMELRGAAAKRIQDVNRLLMAREEELSRKAQVLEFQRETLRVRRHEACRRILVHRKRVGCLGLAWSKWACVAAREAGAILQIQRFWRACHQRRIRQRDAELAQDADERADGGVEYAEGAAAAAMVVQSTFRGYSIRRKFANALEMARLVDDGDDELEFGEVNLDDLIQMPPELEDGWENPVLPASRQHHQHHHERVSQANDVDDDDEEDEDRPESGYDGAEQQREELSSRYPLGRGGYTPASGETHQVPGRTEQIAAAAPAPAPPANLAASLWDKMRKMKQKQRHAAEERSREQDPSYRLQKLMKTQKAAPSKASNNSSNQGNAGPQSTAPSAPTISWGSSNGSGEKKKPKVKLPSLVERLRKKTEAAR